MEGASRRRLPLGLGYHSRSCSGQKSNPVSIYEILSASARPSSVPESNRLFYQCSLLAPLQPHELKVNPTSLRWGSWEGSGAKPRPWWRPEVSERVERGPGCWQGGWECLPATARLKALIRGRQRTEQKEAGLVGGAGKSVILLFFLYSYVLPQPQRFPWGLTCACFTGNRLSSDGGMGRWGVRIRQKCWKSQCAHQARAQLAHPHWKVFLATIRDTRCAGAGDTLG